MKPLTLTLKLIRPGDVLLCLLALGFSLGLMYTLWGQGVASNVLIRYQGKLVQKASLRHNQIIHLPGPLGMTEIEIHNRQVRIRRDPSPRQYCVKQGWLSQAGQVAICLPNLISIELTGPSQDYDSLSF